MKTPIAAAVSLTSYGGFRFNDMMFMLADKGEYTGKVLPIPVGVRR